MIPSHHDNLVELKERLALLMFDDIPLSSRYQRSDIISWLISEYVCQLLITVPEVALHEMRREFESSWRKPGYLAAHLVHRWELLLNGAPGGIISVLRADDDVGAHMRQIRPLGNLISEEVRIVLLDAARRLDGLRFGDRASDGAEQE